MTKEDHDKILLENVTKTYQKVDKSLPNRINTQAKSIAKPFEVDDKLEKISEQQAFFTIKDHKEDFRTNPKYRLLNPTKSDIGKISKIILDRVNDDLRTLTRYNKWKSSKAVIDWFNGIPDKSKCSFSIFDIQEFYLSISENS